jgi:hypothetical protein
MTAAKLNGNVWGNYESLDQRLAVLDPEKPSAIGSTALARQAMTAAKLNGIVWGNHQSLDRRLVALGPPKPLSEWLDGAEPHG